MIEQNATTIAELRMGIERLRMGIRQARGHDGAPQADQSGAAPTAHPAPDAGMPAARRRRTPSLPGMRGTRPA